MNCRAHLMDISGLIRPDPGPRDVEVVFRLDVLQMDEPLLPRLLHPDPGKARFDYKPAHFTCLHSVGCSR